MKKNDVRDGQIRHILSAMGGLLVAVGLITPEDAALLEGAIAAVIGGVSILVAFVWSWRAKGKREAPDPHKVPAIRPAPGMVQPVADMADVTVDVKSYSGGGLGGRGDG